MFLNVKPSLKLKGAINLPASKSYSIRSFMVAACGGHSVIHNPSNCDDALIALKTAKVLGAKVTKASRDSFVVSCGADKNLPSIVEVNESGTVLRFILPLLGLRNAFVQVRGKGTLVGRPNKFLIDALRQMGLKIKGSGIKESVPIKIEPSSLKGGRISIDGSLSSQFISALLIACPQLKDDSILTLKGKKAVSSEYITMTIEVLKCAGIKIVQQDRKTFFIKGKQEFKGLKSFKVPSDYGLAAFHLAAGALIGSNIVLNGNLDQKLVQADGLIVALAKKMGIRFSVTRNSIKIKGPCRLKGGSFSLKDAPDLVPIVSILALFAKGRTRLYDIAHARSKESDRISDLRKELLKIGADITESDNELIINPQLNYKGDVTLNPHSDHRLAMAFAVLGLKVGIKIKNIECVRKSYPDFVVDFKQLGALAKLSSS